MLYTIAETKDTIKDITEINSYCDEFVCAAITKVTLATAADNIDNSIILF